MAVFLFVWFLLFLAVGMVWPSWRVWKRHGQQPWVLPRTDTVEGYVAMAFKCVIASLLVYLALRASGTSSLKFGALHWLENPLAQSFGLVLLACSLILIIVAQAHMGQAWRIGIDHANSGALITSGIFRWLRNPVFMGMRLSLLGVFMVDANGVTLALGLAGEILMQVEVRLEEEFLAHRFGEAYRNYIHYTSRWLGRRHPSALREQK